MNIKKLNEELKEILEMRKELTTVNENEDVEELYSIIPILQGYREHLSEWLLNEPENAEEEGAPEIMKAIDIVIDGIESVENV